MGGGNGVDADAERTVPIISQVKYNFPTGKFKKKKRKK